MKPQILLTGMALLGSTYIAHGEANQQQIEKPCFSVNIQNDRVNHATIRQDCDHNFSRTVQAGEQNSATTIQSGKTNSNKVLQYWYDRMEYLGRIRSE